MALRFAQILVLASATRVLASCAYGTHLAPRAEEGETVEVGNFGYSGTIGPLNWAALDDGSVNVMCATGSRQSPIDMVDGVFQLVPASNLTMEIPDMPDGTEFENLGTTVEVIAAQGGSVAFGGKTYEFQQFHFHLPSEHLDNGTSIAMEMHMVLETPEKDIAVVGVFVDIATGASVTAAASDPPPPPPPMPRSWWNREYSRNRRHEAAPEPSAPAGAPETLEAPITNAAGAPSTLLETVFSKVGEISTPGSTVKTEPLVMSELVTALLSGSFKSYSGSLTTPPCSENVQWLVATQKLTIQPATFEKVRSVIGFNARYPQNTPGGINLLALGAQSSASAQVAAAAVAPPPPPPPPPPAGETPP